MSANVNPVMVSMSRCDVYELYCEISKLGRIVKMQKQDLDHTFPLLMDFGEQLYQNIPDVVVDKKPIKPKPIPGQVSKRGHRVAL